MAELIDVGFKVESEGLGAAQTGLNAVDEAVKRLMASEQTLSAVDKEVEGSLLQIAAAASSSGVSLDEMTAKVRAQTLASTEASLRTQAVRAEQDLLGSSTQKTGGILQTLVGIYGAHSTATKELGISTSEVSHQLHALHLVADEAGVKLGGLRVITSALRGGFELFAVALSGAFIVGLEKAADSARIAQEQLTALLGAIEGAQAFKRLSDDAARLGVSTESLQKPFMDLQTAIERVHGEKLLAQMDQLSQMGVRWAPGSSPFAKLGDDAAKASKQAEQVTADLTKVFQSAGIQEAPASKAIDKFVESIAKGGLKVQEFMTLPPQLQRMIAQAFNIDDIGKFEAMLEKYPMTFQQIMGALQKLHPEIQALVVDKTIAQSWDTFKDSIEEAMKAMGEGAGIKGASDALGALSHQLDEFIKSGAARQLGEDLGHVLDQVKDWARTADFGGWATDTVAFFKSVSDNIKTAGEWLKWFQELSTKSLTGGTPVEGAAGGSIIPGSPADALFGNRQAKGAATDLSGEGDAGAAAMGSLATETKDTTTATKELTTTLDKTSDSVNKLNKGSGLTEAIELTDKWKTGIDNLNKDVDDFSRELPSVSTGIVDLTSQVSSFSTAVMTASENIQAASEQGKTGPTDTGLDKSAAQGTEAMGELATAAQETAASTRQLSNAEQQGKETTDQFTNSVNKLISGSSLTEAVDVTNQWSIRLGVLDTSMMGFVTGLKDVDTNIEDAQTKSSEFGTSLKEVGSAVTETITPTRELSAFLPQAASGVSELSAQVATLNATAQQAAASISSASQTIQAAAAAAASSSGGGGGGGEGIVAPNMGADAQVGAISVISGGSGVDSIPFQQNVSSGEVVAVIPKEKAGQSTMSILQQLIGQTPTSIGPTGSGGSISSPPVYANPQLAYEQAVAQLTGQGTGLQGNLAITGTSGVAPTATPVASTTATSPAASGTPSTSIAPAATAPAATSTALGAATGATATTNPCDGMSGIALINCQRQQAASTLPTGMSLPNFGPASINVYNPFTGQTGPYDPFADQKQKQQQGGSGGSGGGGGGTDTSGVPSYTGPAGAASRSSGGGEKTADSGGGPKVVKMPASGETYSPWAGAAQQTGSSIKMQFVRGMGPDDFKSMFSGGIPMPAAIPGGHTTDQQFADTGMFGGDTQALFGTSDFADWMQGASASDLGFGTDFSAADYADAFGFDMGSQWPDTGMFGGDTQFADTGMFGGPDFAQSDFQQMSDAFSNYGDLGGTPMDSFDPYGGSSDYFGGYFQTGGISVVSGGSGTDTIPFNANVSSGEVVAVIPKEKASATTLSTLQSIIGQSPISVGPSGSGGSISTAIASPPSYNASQAFYDTAVKLASGGQGLPYIPTNVQTPNYGTAPAAAPAAAATAAPVSAAPISAPAPSTALATANTGTICDGIPAGPMRDRCMAALNPAKPAAASASASASGGTVMPKNKPGQDLKWPGSPKDAIDPELKTGPAAKASRASDKGGPQFNTLEGKKSFDQLKKEADTKSAQDALDKAIGDPFNAFSQFGDLGGTPLFYPEMTMPDFTQLADAFSQFGDLGGTPLSGDFGGGVGLGSDFGAGDFSGLDFSGGDVGLGSDFGAGDFSGLDFSGFDTGGGATDFGSAADFSGVGDFGASGFPVDTGSGFDSSGSGMMDSFDTSGAGLDASFMDSGGGGFDAGFQTGGTFTVPNISGATGKDPIRASINVTPGEQVSITNPAIQGLLPSSATAALAAASTAKPSQGGGISVPHTSDRASILKSLNLPPEAAFGIQTALDAIGGSGMSPGGGDAASALRGLSLPAEAASGIQTALANIGGTSGQNISSMLPSITAQTAEQNIPMMDPNRMPPSITAQMNNQTITSINASPTQGGGSTTGGDNHFHFHGITDAGSILQSRSAIRRAINGAMPRAG